ncbi:hypothetical protein Cme02nite_67350 [Catellatospora methionotrophica]|uniref:DUF3866 domain-containing protein n=1 Tax=Catellatospora methionotrophica TaxID=121620 RepID=A0A8J3LHG5_9ACTN|nr:hypothetical protein Cme02nite_67350 [Catellatospora methionotrophica]
MERLGRGWHGAQEITVALVARTPDDPATVRALAYPDLVGQPEVGDQVLLNTNALALGLGTGGYAMVVALPGRLPEDTPVPGHIVKARYSPLQTIRLAADEEASPHRDVLAAAQDLDGMPVVVADLHSALPAILAGIHADAPHARVAYLLTDGGALAAGFSRTLDALRDRLAGTVSTGQAWGGDLEAVNVHTGLLAARHVLRADITILSQGPGNLGTGTTWGFSGVAAGEAVNATATLGGRPVGALRISDADPRPRHRGVSHHSLTAFGRVALAPADLVVPAELSEPLAADVARALAPLAARHRIVTVSTTGLDEALRATPVKLSTMGRDLDNDHAYFLTCAAAGRHAAALAEGRAPSHRLA